MGLSGGNDKVAIITGTSGNLGPVWVRTCEELGYKVFPIDIPVYDITEKDMVKYAVEKCLTFHGKPSLVVCNAAIDNAPGGSSDFFDNYERIIDVNLVGHIHLMKALLPDNVADDCLIVNIGSMLGHSGADWRRYRDIGLTNFTKPLAYGLSKAALIQMSRAITTEYGHRGVRGVTLSFGPVDTGKFNPEFGERIKRDIPTGRLVTPDDLAATLKFAIECKALAGTQDVFVEGGILSW